MSDGEHGHATKLYASLFTTVSSMTAGSGTAIGNVISITGPSQTRDAIEISSMDSTSKWREFIPGMLDAGEITFEVNYDGSAAGDASFLGGTNATTGLLKHTSGTSVTYWLNFNDNGTHTTAVSNWTHHSYCYASGVMTALGHAIPFDDKITQSITIKLQAALVYIDIPA